MITSICVEEEALDKTQYYFMIKSAQRKTKREEPQHNREHMRRAHV